MGACNILKNVEERHKTFEGSQVVVKCFLDILPQKCTSILLLDCKCFHAFKGNDILFHHRTFQPNPMP